MEGVCQLISIKEEISESPSEITPKAIKTESMEEKFVIDSSGAEPVDFDKLELTVESSPRTYERSSLSSELFQIKSEFTEPPLDINPALIKDEPIDDIGADTDVSIESDPLTTVQPPHKNVHITKKPANNQQRKKTDSNRPTRADKGKSRFTSYMLWAKEKRQQLLSIHPDLDFASISRKLGEMWRDVKQNEKYNWKRRARRLNEKSIKSPSDKPPTKSVNRKQSHTVADQRLGQHEVQHGLPPLPITRVTGSSVGYNAGVGEPSGVVMVYNRSSKRSTIFKQQKDSMRKYLSAHIQ